MISDANCAEALNMYLDLPFVSYGREEMSHFFCCLLFPLPAVEEDKIAIDCRSGQLRRTMAAHSSAGTPVSDERQRSTVREYSITSPSPCTLRCYLISFVLSFAPDGPAGLRWSERRACRSPTCRNNCRARWTTLPKRYSIR